MASLDDLDLNPAVIRSAIHAYARELEIDPLELPESVADAVEKALRAAIKRGRGYGWFEPASDTRGAFGKVKRNQCYTVHLFDGEANRPLLPKSRYGLHEIAPGQTHKIDIDASAMPRLRAAVTSYAKDHSLKFRVHKIDGGALITRHA